MSIGDDDWFDDEDGRRADKVDGKTLRVRGTFVMRGAEGDEVARIQERKLSMRDTMVIERPDGLSVTVKKALVGICDRSSIDAEGAEDLSAMGDFVEHEYEIERGGGHRRDDLEALVLRT